MDILKKYYRFLLLVSLSLLGFLFSSCVDDVDIENHFNETRKLVLYGRLCPQLDSTYILLSHTQLLYSSHNEGIRDLKDGVVELSADRSHWVRASYDPERKRYLITRAEFPVEEGHTYYIRASHPGFEDVSAFCTVPVARDVDFRFDTVETNHDMHWGEIYNWPHKDLYVQWRDVPGEENAYSLKTYGKWENFIVDDDGEFSISFVCGFGNEWLHEGNTEYEYVSDQGRDGEQMRYLLYEDLDDEDYWDDEDEPVQYYLLFLDRNCYLYENTLVEDNTFNFLMLEPPHTYTNIENGFGLFGAFSMLQVSK